MVLKWHIGAISLKYSLLTCALHAHKFPKQEDSHLLDILPLGSKPRKAYDKYRKPIAKVIKNECWT